MLEIKKQIAFHIKNNSIDVIELCKTLYPTPCYKIFSALFEINVNNNSFLLNQSEIILKSLPAYIQDSAKTSLLLNEISIQQTSNNMSNYLHAIDLQDNLIKNADIVMFGDSITEQGLWNEMIPNYKVANLGISGDTTNGMLKRIDTSININPTTIFIMAGINDLASGTNINETIVNYSKIIECWQKNKINVIVQSTLHVGKRMTQLNKNISYLNHSLLEICNYHRIKFIDLNAILCPEKTLLPEYSCDDLHLNSKAYLEWKTVLNEILVLQEN